MSKNCTECKYFSIDSICTNPHPSDYIFSDVRIPRIKHPELTWCANYTEKIEKEKYE